MKTRWKSRLAWLAFFAVATAPRTAIADDPGAPLPDPVESQLYSTRDAQYRSVNAGNMARNAGHNSIGRGGQNMSHGHHHFNGAQVALGAFQIVQGLLGLLASAAADQMAGTDNSNGDHLSNIATGGPGAGAVGQAGSGAGAGTDAISGQGNANLGAGSGPSRFAAADLSSPDLKAALAQIQDEYGYTPADFLQLVQSGADPKGIFERAPTNPLTPSEAQVAAAGAASATGSGDPGEAAAAALVLSGGTAAAAGVAAPDAGTAAAGTDRGGALRDALSRALASRQSGNADLSPEVRAALAAREAAERASMPRSRPEEELDLFDVIHQKYRERENNLRWGAPLRAAGSQT